MSDLIVDAQHVLTAESRLRALLTAYRAVAEGLELDHVLERIVGAAVSLVHADYGALGVLGLDGRLERFVHTGMDASQVEAIGHLPEGRGVLSAVLQDGQTLRLPHLGDEPRSVGFPAHHPPMDAFLGVPVRTRDHVFGNLYLTNASGTPFTQEDAEMIESLAATAGIAIDNARLFDTARRQERLASALSQVNAALLAPADEDVLTIVAAHVGSVVDADLITIVVPDGDPGPMHVMAAHGYLAESVDGTFFDADGSLSAQAMRTNSVVAAPEERAYLSGALLLGPTAAVPLTAGGKPLGALCVARIPGREAFRQIDLDTVTEFAAHASIAITLAWARRDRQRLEVSEDRARIARDLHDHVIQRLFGAGLNLQALAAADPVHEARLEAQVAELDAAIGEIRTAIFTLRTRPEARTASARHRVLDVAAEMTTALTTAPRLTFRGPVDLAIQGDLVDDVVAVVREALANVARHAFARTSTVIIAAEEDSVSVTIEDDGRGMPVTVDHVGGTQNLRDRARQRHGSFSMATRPHGGTRAHWQVPLDAFERSSPG
ncbi:sensor histidine kinase [Microbacterium sp. TNHR37B]|uniref:sensor histidine kinase n=1 Tax=Microbacterium sp. TNHR37B TaxID=1775956 RepID=UPI0007B30416|nr:GAF domain-containing protein [Microbacterium sp. TNHR37B]KZE91492.1 Hypoxia sensor histidine kinase response regulator DosT [Microbacterium sp. TNHR37B]